MSRYLPATMAACLLSVVIAVAVSPPADLPEPPARSEAVVTKTPTLTPRAVVMAFPVVMHGPTLGLPTATVTPTLTRTALPSPIVSATSSSTATRTTTWTPSPSPVATFGIVTTVPLSSGPKSVAVDPIRRRAIVALYYSSSIALVDLATNRVVATLPTGVPTGHSNGVAVSPSTGLIYVSNRDAGSASEINPNTGATRFFSAGPLPWGVAVYPSSGRVYVASFGGGQLAIIDPATGGTSSIILGGHPGLVAASPWGIIVANLDSGAHVLADSGTPIAFLATGAGTFGVAVHPTDGRLVVTNRAQRRVSIFDRTGYPITSTVLTATPYAVAVNPTTNHVLVITVDGGMASLLMLDVTSGEILRTLPLGPEDANDGAQGLAVDPVLSRVYVAGYATGLLYIIADPPVGPTPTPTTTVSPTATVPPATPTPTQPVSVVPTPTETATPLSTPIGGWSYGLHLPLIMSIPPPTPTPMPTVPPSPTRIIEWDIPDNLRVSLTLATPAPGQAYWRLTRAAKRQDAPEGTCGGGRVNIYIAVRDELGLPVPYQRVHVGWPGDGVDMYTDSNGQTDFPMLGGACYNPAYSPGPFHVYVGDLPSDTVWGMGLPLCCHIYFELTWQRTIAPTAVPQVVVHRGHPLLPLVLKGDR